MIDGKTRKTMYVATGCPQGEEKLLEVEIGSTKSRCV
jgi:hypothetical protein